MKTTPLIIIAPCTQKQGAEFCDVSLSLSNCYALSILASGGLPWVMPPMVSPQAIAECVRRANGVMLTGGEDVQPELYLPSVSPSLRRKLGPPDPPRDLFELLLIDEVFRQRKPLLAICRGQQILNVALGGTLILDIASQCPKAFNHRRMDRKDHRVHDVTLTPGSMLSRIMGKSVLGVNSSHHQAVDRIAQPLQVNAVSDDGVIEGLELRRAEAALLPYLMSVQFHPERLWLRHGEFLELFGSFIRACDPIRKKTV